MQLHSSSSSQRARSLLPAEPVIHSEPRVFYAYSPEFTSARPLGYLMKCKANKSRPLIEAPLIDHHIDLVFLFERGAMVSSPNADSAVELLEDVMDTDQLKQTALAAVNISEFIFREICSQKNSEVLARIVNLAINEHAEPVIALSVGTIIAVKTETGKYGLMLVKSQTAAAVTFDACHVLLD